MAPASRRLAVLLSPVLLALAAPARVSAAEADAADAGTAASVGDAATGEVEPSVVPSVQAAQLEPGSIVVDGEAADPGWREASWSEGFVQTMPEEGRPASERTRFKIATDGRELFVLVEAFDSRPAEVMAMLTRRDQASTSDWVDVLLDTSGDKRSAYRFKVNPAGVRVDARIGSDNVEDSNWDAVWLARVASFEGGWRVELGIPLGQLRWPDGTLRWGVQVMRTLQRRAETDVFSPMASSEVYLPKRFGKLQLPRLPTPWRMELFPYAGVGILGEGSDWGPLWNVGLDGRVGLGSAFTLDVTVNPDFGQIEADPSELNLTAFETYQSERRPFFLEGADQFRYSLLLQDWGYDTLFYSRRIGRAPERDPEDYGEVKASPQSTTILGALKLTGRTSDGWAVGLMDAVTQPQFADIVVDGDQRRLLVEPLTQMAVLRVTRDFREGQTQVGVLATHLWRRLAFDSAGFFPEQSATGGIDVENRFGDWQLTLKLYGSYLRGTPEAIDRVQRSSVHYLQRPDVSLGYDPNATELAGWGTVATFGKFTGAPFRGAISVYTRSPGLDVNDLGYLPAADEQNLVAWAQYRDETPGWGHQRWNVGLEIMGTRTFEEELNRAMADVYFNWTLPETSYLYAGFLHKLDYLDPRALRGGPGLTLPGLWNGWFGFGTDERRAWTVGLDGNWTYEDEDAGYAILLWPWLKVRPHSSVDVTLGPQWRHTRNKHQWATDLADDAGVSDRWFVGDLERDVFAFTLRVNWSLTADLSLQWYAMPYVTTGTWASYSEVVAPRAGRFAERLSQVSSGFAHDVLGLTDGFLYAQVRSNLVLRWEFQQGAAFYLVWSHEQTDDRDDTGRLSWEAVGHLSDQPATDVVMAKLVWWWAR
ncbi:MAG: DUF5916 domain-containing protein [Myxococcales bacterium]